MVKGINKVMPKKEEEAVEEGPSKEEEYLGQIVELLKKQDK